jgi:hypothetical protein
MNDLGSGRAHRRERRLIDRHFQGRSTPPDEAVLRAHLTGCASCRAYYDRHLVLAEIDPAAPRDDRRMAAALGLESGRRRLRWWSFSPVLALAGAAALLLVARAGGVRQFSPRGGGAGSPAFYAYRVVGQEVRPLGEEMDASDELAFAYQNPTGFRGLAVVAVDEDGGVTWYHPDVSRSDRALPIVAGAERVELPEAIVHPLRSGLVRILGIFTGDTLAVRQIDRLLDRTGCEGLRARLPGSACLELRVRVHRKPSR